jgi:hypothetical protein
LKTEAELRELLAEYVTLIGRHASAEEFMAAVLTDDFETGFEGGYSWRGLDGLRDFLSQREGFFDEKHTIKAVLAMEEPSDGEVRAHPGSSSSCAVGRRPRPPAKSSPALASTTGACVASPIAGGSPRRSSSASRTSTTTPSTCSRRPTRVSTAEEAPPRRGLPERIDERRAQLNAYSS